ncbi:MAG: bifunctional folylpolyglutamate synthase/dihydrofolate synthase [Clostridia bacterium]|nr:bifunctional folylpolyglutamate synthase/dihydrofolate synthase [Clostridia bacterium]
MTYEQALDFIHSRIHLGTRRGLFRMEGLMEKLGNPEKRMKFVHIAGSNGKGSTATMCESVLRHAGHKTGLFLSPYVFDFRERMQVDGQLPDKQLMADVLESMLPALAEMKAEDKECTEFETVTALALMLFERCGVDTVVFEVGIGGLLDSTNIIPAPLCAAVGSISLEHTDILGTTIPEIAAQKCGIIKRGCRAAGYCDLLPEAEQVLRQTCRDLDVPLTVADKAKLQVLESDDTGSRFLYDGREYRIALPGGHQIMNALTVLSVVDQLRKGGMDLPEAVVAEGLADAMVIGRLQVVRQSPKCVIDGAHNPGKVGALCAALDSLYPGRPIIGVMGMMNRKDHRSSVPQLAKRCRIFIAVPAADDLPFIVQPEVIAEVAREHCADVRVCASAEEGARLALQLATEEDVLVATGSMYLLSSAKKGFTAE